MIVTFAGFLFSLLLADLPTSEFITQLTSLDQVKSDNFYMVVFYREGCPHCVRLMPDYVTLANDLHDFKGLKFGRVDCPNSGDLCSAEQIGGVPTIKLYYKTWVVKYEGKRDVNTIKKWLEDYMANDGEKVKNPPPPTPPPPPSPPLPKSDNVIQLNKISEFQNAISSDNFYFITFYHDDCHHCRSYIPIHNQVADTLHTTPNLKIARVDCPNAKPICENQKVKGVPTIKVFHKGVSLAYTGPRDVKAVSEWIADATANDGVKIHSTPPPPTSSPSPSPPLPKSENVVQLDSSTEFQNAIASDNFYFVTFYRDNCPHCLDYIPTHNQVADAMHTTPNLRFGRVDCPNAGSVCTEHEVKGVPTIRLYHKGAKLSYTGLRDVKTVSAWIADGIANNGARIHGGARPTPPPPTPSVPPSPSGPLPRSENVIQLDQSNWGATAEKAAEDFWLVTFYRDSCPHCKNFIPVQNTLADKMKDTPRLKFGRVDCPNTGSICSQQGVQGVPTIKLFYKGANIKYEGGRNVDSLTKWLNESMSNDGAKVTGKVAPPPSPTNIDL